MTRPLVRGYRRHLAAMLAVALLAPALAAGSAAAQNFHRTNAQLLYGARFDDARLGNDPRDGELTTLTLEEASAWRYGDSFLFVDMTRGDFPGGERYRLYAEWAPRLSLSKLSGRRVGLGPIGDVLVAGGVNRGHGFHANLLGVGTDLKLPGFAFLQLNAYWRDDNFNDPTYQITPVWLLPLQRGRVALSFGGFADVMGTDDDGVDVLAQPQLLLDLGALVGARAGAVQAGLEWYFHDVGDERTSAPQAMVKVRW